jgi:hypothetical protein
MGKSPIKGRAGPDGAARDAGPGVAREGDGGAGRRYLGGRERVRHQVGTTLSSIAWSIREQAHGSGIWAESGAARGRRPSAEPLVVGRADFWGWPGGWARRGRREPVPGGLAAASMPRTPREPTHPATDRFLRGQPRKTEQKSKAKAGRFALQCLISDSSGCRPAAATESIHAWRGSTADRGNLSKAGWVRCGAGRGWMAAPPWRTGLRRVLLAPPPPSTGTAVALAVAVAVAQPRQVPGAARPKPFPASGTMSGPFPNYGSRT